ncbi:hypothetical protein ACSBR1_026492 [Camellia fascicularis]
MGPLVHFVATIGLAHAYGCYRTMYFGEKATIFVGFAKATISVGFATAISVSVTTVVLRRATPDSVNSASSHSFKNQPKSHTFWWFRNRKSLQRKRRTFAFEPSLLYQMFFPNLFWCNEE